MFYWSLTIWLYAEIAVTARNIVFEIDASRDELDAEFAKLPPCKIESNISIDGVEYPIVRSHPAPCYVEWHDSWDHINRQLMTLINLGHGMWSYCWQFAFWFLLINHVFNLSTNGKKEKKSSDLGEISHGKIFTSTWSYPWFAIYFKGGYLGAWVHRTFMCCTRLHCHLIFRFFCKDISFVDWKTTRPRREGRRRWDHAWLAYFHVWGNYSAGSRPQVQIKCAIFWCQRYAHSYYISYLLLLKGYFA